jgi:hypothetical protein
MTLGPGKLLDDLARPGPDQPIPAAHAPWYIAVALGWFKRSKSGCTDADNLVDWSAASLLDPGHPCPPGPVDLHQLPGQQVTDDRIV